MSSTRTLSTPVLIVGAGPAGLATAIALARLGVECLLVERRRTLSALPRATVISTRSMEILRSWGLQETVLASAVDVEFALRVCETLVEAGNGSSFEVGLPSAPQSAMVSPTGPACVAQDDLEAVLLSHLRSLPSAHVRLGTEVVSVDQRQDHAEVRLRDMSTAETHAIEAGVVVAADGAHSTVRSALGIPMVGPDDLHRSVTAVFRAPLWDVIGDHRYLLYVVTREGGADTLLPAGPNDRWVAAIEQQPGTTFDDYGPDRFAELIRVASGVNDLEPQVERIGAFAFAAQIAPRFRDRNVFLVGDAAHRVTPRGGTGMNIALHDGNDLGWKLAWVLRGWARPELLDSYEAERRPLVEHNLARSADPNGSRRDAWEGLRVDLGARLRHVWVPARDDRASTLDLLGPGLTLFTGPDRLPWATAIGSLGAPMPLDLTSLDPVCAMALGVRDGGAMLARPDGSPVASWPPGTDALSALRSVLESFPIDLSTDVRDVA